MNFLPRLSSRIWIIALLAAGGFLLWIDAGRIRRVEYISALAEPVEAVDAASPTGYAAGLRRLIVPEHNNDSYQWIAQTQQMLARGEWRVRHVAYDNAPLGRDVRTPSPYRWWLGLVAWCDHAVSGQPLGLAVEHAALWADPALHLLLLAVAVFFTARSFGPFPATWLALAITLAFPFAGAFLPGQPNDGGLTHLSTLGSVLLLLAGIGLRPSASPGSGHSVPTRRTQVFFFFAGAAGGIGLWVNAPRMTPILTGIALGGIMAAWIARRTRATGASAGAVLPWRAWALGGAVTSLAAYLVEYFPAHLGELNLETIHPLYGCAWLGLGEILEQSGVQSQRNNSGWSLRQRTTLLLAVLAVAAVPIVLRLTGDRGLGADYANPTRLTNLPNSPIAQNLWTWIGRDGITVTAAVTLLPLLLLGPVLWSLARRQTAAPHRQALALALGPVLVALVLAFFHLSWWSLLDCALLSLLVAATSPLEFSRNPRLVRWLWSGGLALVLAAGAVLLVTTTLPKTSDGVMEGEVEALLERDLAYWLASQAGPGGAVVLAPPSLTTSLYFHGGLSGLGTPYAENKDGFAAAVRIAGATSPDEAQAVAQSRHLNYIVLPSWDPFLDEYARLASGKADHSLTALLHQWMAPRWLRPVPYRVPKTAGFEGLSVVIFAVVDVQENAPALSRLAEYFLEMSRVDQAASVSQALEHFFPSDLGALVARSRVEHAQGDAVGLAHSLNEIETGLARGDDNTLLWDRRVSLAIALAEGKHLELAREQTRRCLAELDEARVRSLTTVSLYRLQVLGKAFGLGLPDPQLRTLAQALLPIEMRDPL